LNTETGRVDFTLDQFPNDSYWEFTTSRSLAVMDGQAWCGLNDFLSVVNIQRIRKTIPPIQPAIVSMTLNSKSIKKESKLKINQGDWVLKIELSCHWFWSKTDIRYQYRVLGLHADWIDIIGNQIILAGLQAGKYLLEVKARCNLSATIKEVQLLELEIIPSSFMNRCFHFMLHAVGRLYDYIVNKRLLKQHSSEFYYLEEMIKRRTQQLNEAKEKLEQQNRALVEMSTIDPLTGLYNRRYFSEQAMKEVKRAVRSQLPMCLLMIDIDHFKQYNDHYGHKQGDECLKQIALKIRNSFNRSTDITARYGGEEFIVLLPETTLEEAKLAIEKCLNNVRKSNIEHAKSWTANIVTISIGLACATPQYDFDQKSTATFLSELIEQADVNLYHAKNNGRNQYFG
jgi:diguanylate cyclase (GGDEF)-like protein